MLTKSKVQPLSRPASVEWKLCKCCRMGDPFQSLKVGSCLTLRNELSEETRVWTKQEPLLGRGVKVENSGVREPRTALPHGSKSQSLVLWKERSLMGYSLWDHKEFWT